MTPRQWKIRRRASRGDRSGTSRHSGGARGRAQGRRGAGAGSGGGPPREAEREAQALLDGARKTLAAERERALEEARRVALDLGAEFARRLLAEVPIELRAEAWIERIEQHLKALPKTELDSLARQLTDGSSLTVVTAAPLPPETADTGATAFVIRWVMASRCLRREPGTHRRGGTAFPDRRPALLLAGAPWQPCGRSWRHADAH